MRLRARLWCCWVLGILIGLTGCQSHEAEPSSASSLPSITPAASSSSLLSPAKVAAEQSDPTIQSTALASPTTNWNTSIQQFMDSVSKKDPQGYQQGLNPSGVAVIRSFVSGGAGVRGKDIRNYYPFPYIGKDFQFDVSNETPVSLANLFSNSLGKQIKDIQIKDIHDLQFNMKDDGKRIDPPTRDIVATITKMIGEDKNPKMDPRIYNLDQKEVVLSEASLIEGIPIGSFALFTPIEGQYKLHAIIDLR